MGACICKNAPYTKPYEVQSLDNKDIASSLESPNPAKDGDGLTRHHQTKSIVKEIKISSMALCDKDTLEICEVAVKIINVLSIYHQFINEYIDYIEESQRRQTRSNNLLNMINDKYSEYDLITLRDDYHHLITYHEANKAFMKKLFYQLMEQNHDHSIDNLAKINKKLDRDQEKQTYFGHKMSDEIRMIQTLNQVHYDVTNKFQSAEDIAAVVSDEEENDKEKDPEIEDEDRFIQDNFGMNIDDLTAGRQRSTAHHQLLEDDETKSGSDIQRKDTNTSMTSQSTEEDDDEDEDEEEDEDKISLPKPRNRYKMKKNRMNKKRGFYKGAAVDDDDHKGNNDMRIDAKYEKGGNKARKVGRLKMRKPQKQYQPVAKTKAGKAKIVNDDSWMDQSQQKKSKHVVSESIQMLGSTKLVTNNSFKAMSTLTEDNDDDDANFKPKVDFQTLDMEQFNEDMSFTRRRSAGVSVTAERPSRFNENYDVDQD